MPTLLPLRGHGGYYIWKYVPNEAASVIFILLWIAAILALSWKIWKAKAWFCVAFAVGCLMQVIGYAARAAAANQTDRLMPYVIQSAFILLPPALFAASIYTCFGRLIRYVRGDHVSVIRPGILTKVFVAGDVVSFLVQGSSSGFTVLGSQNAAFPIVGEALVLTGLALQLISFGIFVYTIVVFHRRIRSRLSRLNSEEHRNWTAGIRMLYITSTLIIVRSIFRIVEFSLGQDGYALSNEWTLYVFDSVPMLVVAVTFCFLFPSYLVGAWSIERGDDDPMNKACASDVELSSYTRA